MFVLYVSFKVAGLVDVPKIMFQKSDACSIAVLNILN